MDFIHPSRCSKIDYDLGSIHQDGCLGQEKQHTWSLGTNTGQTQVTATLSLLLPKFTPHWFISFLLFCSLQHKTYTTNSFSPRLNVLNAHTGFPHPTALATKYTMVLEQRQTHEWACLSPRGKGVRHLNVFEDSYFGGLLEVIQKVTERQDKRLLWICTKIAAKFFFHLFLPCLHLLNGLVARWWRSATVPLPKYFHASYSSICNIS